jgi:hypothetical protein
VNTRDKNQHLEVQLVAPIEARLVEGALSHRRRFDLDHHLGKCQAADPEESRRRLRNLIAKLPKRQDLHTLVRDAYWSALDQAGSAADGEARLRALVGELETDYPGAAAALAQDLPALCVHLGYPLRLRKRLRSTTSWNVRWAR